MPAIINVRRVSLVLSLLFSVRVSSLKLITVLWRFLILCCIYIYIRVRARALIFLAGVSMEMLRDGYFSIAFYS